MSQNQYADRIRRHWQMHLPDQVAQLTDPEAFFARQGEEAEEQITELTDQLLRQETERNPEATSTYLNTVGTTNMARRRAEEKVMTDMLPPPTTLEPNSDLDEETPDQTP